MEIGGAVIGQRMGFGVAGEGWEWEWAERQWRRRECGRGGMRASVEVGGPEGGDEHDGDERIGSDALLRGLGAVSERCVGQRTRRCPSEYNEGED